MIVPSCDPPVIVTSTSACVGGVLTGYAAPAMVGAVSAVGRPVQPVISSGITAIAGCSMTSEAIP